MNIEELDKNIKILDKIYAARQEKLGKCTEELKEKLNDVSIEELQQTLEKSIENTKKRNEVIHKLDLLVENYEIKMSSFIEDGYKQGFKDAFELFMECERK